MTAIALGLPRVRPTGAPSTPGRPDTEALVDRFGRVAHDLRVSVTEKCSLRCTYCMPAVGLPAIPRDDLLTPGEIGRLVGIGYRLGIRDVRFTGGEPLMRPDLAEIVRRTRAAAPGVRISMTTNAIGLDKRVGELVDAGLDRVNVSLDTVDRTHFAELTRRDRLPQVLAGIQAALDAGLSPVKLNAVLMPETLTGATDLLAWAVEHGCRLRFIEQMPLDADQSWARDRLVSAERLLDVLGTRFDLTPVGREDPSAPAEEWAVDGGPATVGIIASVTRSFCGDCDRTRLTAEGTVRSCLFGNEEVDLRALLRSGPSAGSSGASGEPRGDGSDDAATDAAIVAAWQGAMWAKPFAHGLDRGAPDAGAIGGSADDPEAFARTERSMGAIGG
ncbi:GTP 3',8-cyclase MoaA [Oerskovia turbata]|uniref:GTP 3',8-cyclase n=1 Tax=Oerskovia turbata TaxID=1713 RepID=A0A4Q1L1T2_9CELL|nr:GTP 3',8-cyclase MoaA [Oerskovia turbata]RXR28112.1 GTP 3',8-cyclase MoaA [Oerskovia turbata]RXR35879.1 GTP 3',8-cyclase MoaA [Oerskovia turbata]TGJ94798.1 GTP 3',8-cyclase MoaA [Actinotalea fermentans ATCC 43279 = JCM 9966 = DSM 3133]